MKTLSKWIMIALMAGLGLHCMQSVMGPQRDSGPDAIAQDSGVDDAGVCSPDCTCEIECPPTIKRIVISGTMDASSVSTVYIDDWDGDDPPMIQYWVKWIHSDPDLDSWRQQTVRLHPSGSLEIVNQSAIAASYRIVVVK